MSKKINLIKNTCKHNANEVAAIRYGYVTFPNESVPCWYPCRFVVIITTNLQGCHALVNYSWIALHTDDCRDNVKTANCSQLTTPNNKEIFLNHISLYITVHVVLRKTGLLILASGSLEIWLRKSLVSKGLKVETSDWKSEIKIAIFHD